MFEVKNNGNLISGLASTTSAQLTAAQVVRCSTSHTGPQHGQQDYKYKQVSDGFKMILKEQCVAWCIRESIEPCFPYFPSRRRIASAYFSLPGGCCGARCAAALYSRLQHNFYPQHKPWPRFIELIYWTFSSSLLWISSCIIQMSVFIKPSPANSQ